MAESHELWWYKLSRICVRPDLLSNKNNKNKKVTFKHYPLPISDSLAFGRASRKGAWLFVTLHSYHNFATWKCHSISNLFSLTSDFCWSELKTAGGPVFKAGPILIWGLDLGPITPQIARSPGRGALISMGMPGEALSKEYRCPLPLISQV